MQGGRKGFPAAPSSVPQPPSQLSESNRRIIGGVPEGPPKRVYQLWKGNNRFFFGGRLIFGPDARSVLLTVCLIVVPVILFLVFVSQRLLEEFQHGYGDVIVAVAVIFTIYVLLLLIVTSSRDPGIIPRNKHPPEPEEDAISNGTGGSCRGPTLPPTKDVMVNGIAVKVKYCQTCMLYRPPRCSHCSICNNCVERFDHHCPWVGQCIGKRNYRFFFMFVSSTTILCLYVFGFCWVNLKKIMVTYKCNLWKALLESPVSGILILYTFVAVWFVGGLTAFHLYLISTNQTTYENFRYRYDLNMNPYNLGCFWNFKEIFFSSVPPSKHDFRAVVKDEMGVFNPSSIRMSNVLSPDAAKRSVDLEMGMKRQTVAMEELEDIQSQIDSMGGMERSGTQPAHASSGRQGGHWEITQDLQALAAELGMQHEPSTTAVTGAREKITGSSSSNS